MKDSKEKLIGVVTTQIHRGVDGNYRITVDLPGVITYSMEATYEELADAIRLVEKRVGECFRDIVADHAGQPFQA